VRVVVALGKIAFDVYLSIPADRGVIRSRSAFVFAHMPSIASAQGSPLLISCIIPASQNTSTGKLTEKMLMQVFLRQKAQESKIKSLTLDFCLFLTADRSPSPRFR